jgi:RHS repeat-associated protein
MSTPEGTDERKFVVKNGFETRLTRHGTYWIAQQSSEQKDYVGLAASEPVRTKSATFGYDAFGNRDLFTDSIQGVADTTLAITYENREETWLLGLPERETLTSTANGVSTTRTLRRTFRDDGLADSITREPESLDVSVRLEVKLDWYAWGGLKQMDTLMAAVPPRTERYSYDDDGTFIHRTENAAGHVQWVGFHGGLGQPLIAVDPNGVETRWQYDGIGRTRTLTSEAGEAEATDYATGVDFPLAITRTPAGGLSKTQFFDSRGHAVRVGWVDEGGNDIEGRTAYDRFGRPFFFVRPHMKSQQEPDPTQVVYDNLDRIVRVTHPDSTAVRWEYPSFFETRRFDEAQHETRTILDGAGQLLSSIDVLKTSAGSRDIATNFAYGPFGLPMYMVRSSDARIAVTLMGYDVVGRRTTLIDPDMGLTATGYNAAGDVVLEITGETQSAYVRDALGRAVGGLSSDGAWAAEWDTRPNGKGSLSSISSTDGIVSESFYDSLGRLERELNRNGSDKLETKVSYDTNNRIDVLTYPEVPGRSSRFAIRNSYDSRTGRLSGVMEAGTGDVLWSATKRDVMGRLQDESLVNGVEVKRTFDDRTGRLSRVSAMHGNQVVQDLAYTYHPNGQVESKANSLTGTDLFEYDSLGRLSRWSVLGQSLGQTDYRYDDLGNPATVSAVLPMVGQRIGTLTYEYDSLKVHAVTSAGGATYRYDRDGRQTSRVAPGSIATINYNRFDLPTRITSTAGNVSFKYTGRGDRYIKRSGNLETTYAAGIYERRRPVTLGLPSNFTAEHIFYIPGESGLIGQVTRAANGTETRTFLHDDLVGTVVAASKADGSPQASPPRYEPFGRVLGGSLPAGVKRGFGGHEFDGEMNLVNMNGRIYDPALGRFLTPDPVVQDASLGQGFNRYSYVLNDPVRLSDPTGYQTICYDSLGACPAGGSRVTQNGDGEFVFDFTIPQMNGYFGGVMHGGTVGGVPTVTTGGVSYTQGASGWVSSPFAQGFGGFTAGLIQGFVPGGVLTDLIDAAAGTRLSTGRTSASQLGKGIGQLVSGGVQLILGLGGSAGGGFLSATGVGAFIGVPAVAVSAGAVTNGSLAFGSGVANISAVFAKAPMALPGVGGGQA